MAVDTGHLVLWDRVVGKLRELHANLLMASVAEFGHLLPTHFLLRSFMQTMAVETADIASGMSAGIPVMKIGRGGRGMAFETDERLGLGREFFQRQQIFESTAFFAVSHLDQLIDGEATGTVTRLAVDERQTARCGNLGAVYRLVEVFGNLVVFMALGETGLVADVIGIEAADDHPFVLTDGFDRLVGTKGGEVGTGGQKHHANGGKDTTFNHSPHQDNPPGNIKHLHSIEPAFGSRQVVVMYNVQESWKPPQLQMLSPIVNNYNQLQNINGKLDTAAMVRFGHMPSLKSETTTIRLWWFQLRQNSVPTTTPRADSGPWSLNPSTAFSTLWMVVLASR